MPASRLPPLPARATLLLGLTLVLAACARSDPAGQAAPAEGAAPWSDRLEPPGADPYAGGKTYPWVGLRTRAPGPLGAQALSADNFLSDISWTSATNSYGPVEKDMSNGNKAAGDGKTLTVGGQTYPKGLGVHGVSDLSYALEGQCSTFTASVGVDDEVGSNGSVVFQVWNGTATKLYDSGTVRGTDGPKAVSVNVSGVSNLRLVVTNAGDGASFDHADWAAAKVSCPPRVPTGDSDLSDLAWASATNSWGPVERNLSNGEQGLGDGRVLTIGGQTYPKGLGAHANATLAYTLGGACTTFTASVGVDDEVGSKGSVAFQVFGDGVKLYESPVQRGTDGPLPISVPVNGVNELKLVATDGGDGASYDHADWAAARVACTADTTAPGAPGNLAASGAAGGVTLSWTASPSPDLAGYRLERAPASGGAFTTVAPGLLKASTYTDAYAPEGTASVYRLTAVDASGNASAPVGVTASRPPAAPATRFTYGPLASQPYGIAEAQGRAVNGKVYTFGGFDPLKGCCTPTDRAYVYDPAANTWTPLPNFPARGVTHAGIATDGRALYVAGGYIANADWTFQVFGTKAVWRYDLTTQTYSRLPDLPVERAAGQLEELDGKLHYFGGTNLARTQDVGDHYVLDLARGASAWTVAAPLPNPRNHLGSAVLGGLIYAIGGQHHHDEHLTTQATVNAYNPATDRWSSLSDLPLAVSHIANSTFVLGGRIIVAGGEKAHLQSVGGVYAYDPASNTWTALTSLPSARMSGVAAPIGNGFLFIGGDNSASGWRATP